MKRIPIKRKYIFFSILNILFVGGVLVLINFLYGRGYAQSTCIVTINGSLYNITSLLPGGAHDHQVNSGYAPAFQCGGDNTKLFNGGHGNNYGKIAAFLVTSTSTPTPTPTTQLTSTPTSNPTSTPAPTLTTGPTNTPAPTQTVVPTGKTNPTPSIQPTSISIQSTPVPTVSIPLPTSVAVNPQAPQLPETSTIAIQFIDPQYIPYGNITVDIVYNHYEYTIQTTQDGYIHVPENTYIWRASIDNTQSLINIRAVVLLGYKIMISRGDGTVVQVLAYNMAAADALYHFMIIAAIVTGVLVIMMLTGICMFLVKTGRLKI